MRAALGMIATGLFLLAGGQVLGIDDMQLTADTFYRSFGLFSFGLAALALALSAPVGLPPRKGPGAPPA
jgi:hypothetical protein